MAICNKASSSSDNRIVTLKFKRSELLYDVSNYSFVEADILPQDAEHVKHQVFDIVQDGNVDRVTRIINLAISECVEMLYPYTRQDIGGQAKELNDILIEPEEYVISLSLPSTFSMTTVDLLENLIHEFLVCRVLEDWLSITLPQSMERWSNKVLGLKDRIRTSLVSRTGKVQRKLKPW